MSIWGKKESELPKELQDLTPEQLLEAVQKAGSVDQLQADLATERQSRTDAQNEVNAIKGRLQELEGRVPRPQPQATERTSFVDDEDRAFNERFNDSSQGISAVALQSGKLAAKLEAIRQVQSLAASNPKMRGAYRLWQKYEGEIEALVAQQAPANHIFPQTWINAFTYVKGLHAEELVEGAVSGGENFFSEPVGGGGAPENDRGGQKKDELSPREMDIARKMKITPERYLEQKKKMVVVSET